MKHTGQFSVDSGSWVNKSDGKPVDEGGKIIMKDYCFVSDPKWEIPVASKLFAKDEDKGVPVGARVYRLQEAILLMDKEMVEYWSKYAINGELLGKNLKHESIKLPGNGYLPWVIYAGGYEEILTKQAEVLIGTYGSVPKALLFYTAEDKNAKLEETVHELESTIEDLRHTISVLKGDLSDTKGEYSELCDDYRTEIASLKKELIATKKEKASLSTILRAVKEVVK